MAKKSNKTEQVLKLITKEGEEQIDDAQAADVEINVKSKKEQQHKIETKLKIEIEPEIEIKAPAKSKKDPQVEVSVHNNEKPQVDAPPQNSEDAKADAPMANPERPQVEEPVHNSDKPQVDAPPQNLGDVEDENKECLVNLTECLVKEKVEEIMEKLNVCRCHTCTQNVLALALNSLSNRYTTTNAGRLHVKLDFYKKQYETDVIAALTKACVRVKVSPRHERRG